MDSGLLYYPRLPGIINQILKGTGKMVRLIPVTEDNWMEIASLAVKEHQKSFVAPAIGILARGYVYRGCNAKVFAFEEDGVTPFWYYIKSITIGEKSLDPEFWNHETAWQKKHDGHGIFFGETWKYDLWIDESLK